MKAKITKRTIDSSTPGTKDKFVWDTETKGFGIKVTPAAKRIYILQARFTGRLRRYTIGKHGSPWTPDAARTEAVRMLGLIAAGIDPAKEKSMSEPDLTMAQLGDLYLSEGCAHKKASTFSVDTGLVRRHIKPLLGHKRIADLTRPDIEKFLVDVAAGKTATDKKTKKHGRAIVRGGKGTANRTVALLAAIFSFAISRDFRSDNPARGVKTFKLPSRERFLAPAEFARLGDAMAGSEAKGENPMGIAAVRLLAMTGCRKSEILTLKWAHIDFERSCLRLPDSKTGAKVVAVGAPVLELLRRLPRLDGSPYVLPAARGDGHYTGLPKVWDRIRSRAGLEDVRLHDLRHSYASVGASGGDSLLIIGRLLGHRQASTTQRYAHLSDDPLRSAADRIAGQIAASMNTKNVDGIVIDIAGKGHV